MFIFLTLVLLPPDFRFVCAETFGKISLNLSKVWLFSKLSKLC